MYLSHSGGSLQWPVMDGSPDGQVRSWAPQGLLASDARLRPHLVVCILFAYRR